MPQTAWWNWDLRYLVGYTISWKNLLQGITYLFRTCYLPVSSQEYHQKSCQVPCSLHVMPSLITIVSHIKQSGRFASNVHFFFSPPLNFLTIWQVQSKIRQVCKKNSFFLLFSDLLYISHAIKQIKIWSHFWAVMRREIVTGLMD